MKVLSRLRIKADGSSEDTFYKGHPNSKFNEENKSQEKPVDNNNKLSDSLQNDGSSYFWMDPKPLYNIS